MEFWMCVNIGETMILFDQTCSKDTLALDIVHVSLYEVLVDFILESINEEGGDRMDFRSGFPKKIVEQLGLLLRDLPQFLQMWQCMAWHLNVIYTRQD